MKIIVADDHHIVRQGLLALIQKAQIGTIIADTDSGEQAWSLIRLHEPDIAILDISIGNISGLSICHRIQSHELKTRVIFLTVHKDIKTIDHALEAGASGYLLKNDTFATLVDAMQAVYLGKRYISPANKKQLHHYRTNKPDFEITLREKEVIGYVAQGMTNKQIGDTLCISAKTVDAHRTRVMKKLGFNKSAQLVRFAIKEGICF
ncbi:two-component system, NarL family, nitrate/nitrite response regulator NarL [Pseudoalteromonas rubra]|uniref:Two-component system, NarL family, nitrate/nitrite response regulator NarL n=1 Tax=Pseudoalteromonas rubra TaxID=43658 RepID=A0A8T0CBA2_9GAMM|nr:response regulator transcription factor [Pseudoalteromonas rubra]KAF7787973.1 two-component system, NarL family, nitrate/nitrite response regulator NarL [Pseudoalteromonas rubra]